MVSIDPIRPYLPLIYGGVIAAVVAVIGYQHWRIGTLKEQRGRYKTAVAQYAGAQGTNLQTIEELRRRLDELTAQAALDRRAATAAVLRAQESEANANLRLEAATQELAHVYEKSATARAWGSTGVDADVARSLPAGRNRPH